jgi:DNA-binding CsgD family transcriptional regulator
MSGHAGPADAALAELGEQPPHWMVVFDPDLIDRGRAWAKAAAGEVSAACTILRDSAARASQHLWATAEAKLRHDLVRLGEARSEASRLRELAAKVEGPLASAFAQHAEAVVADSPGDLEETAERFAGLRANLLAAEAFTEAASAFRRRGLARPATTVARRAEELRAIEGLGRTPALTGPASLNPLTKREREVAMLAASGLSSREIAERLYVSVRTVDNQLQRVYAKLGITSREALSDSLGAS